MPALPQELLDLIIDELRGDVSTLKACALSSSALLDRARTHLFGDVVLTPQTASTFTTAARPPFSHVQHLRLIGLGRTALRWSQLDFSMTHIARLSLINVDTSLLLRIKWPGTIERLYLNFLRVDTHDTFFALVRSFPRLQHLTLYQFYCTADEQRPRLSRQPGCAQPIRLRTLELSFRYSRSDVVDMLTAAHAPFVLDDLEALTIKPSASDTDGLQRIADALHVGGDSLLTLHVGPFRFSPSPPIPRLRLFRALHVCISDRPSYRHLLQWWTALFATPAWDLQTLTVSAAVHFVDWDAMGSALAEQGQWEDLARALGGRSMPCLRRVTVCLELREGPSKHLCVLEQIVTAAFATCSHSYELEVLSSE